MSIPTKNGIPWTGLYRLDEPAVKPQYLDRLNTIFNRVNWGDDYENHRRLPHQKAIYPDTRCVSYIHNRNLQTPLGNISVDIYQDVCGLFPQPMTLLYSELVLLTPYGTVGWHHDRMIVHHLSTRLMLPFTDNGDDITYYFTSWGPNVPTTPRFLADNGYVGSDLQEYTMRPGHYYVYNHRVPHKTVSRSSQRRGLLQLELMPTEAYNNYLLPNGTVIKDGKWFDEMGAISEFEKTKILRL